MKHMALSLSLSQNWQSHLHPSEWIDKDEFEACVNNEESWAADLLLTYIRGKRSFGFWACKPVHLGLLLQAHLEDIYTTTKHKTNFAMGHKGL